MKNSNEDDFFFLFDSNFRLDDIVTYLNANRRLQREGVV